MLWTAVLLYVVAAVTLGWLARRRRGGAREFWTAGRGLGAGAVGLSISAGFMSVSWSCVYAVQLFYWYGLGAVWLITVPWILALAGIYLLSRRYHALPEFSQPEMVGRRFGRPARVTVATAVALVFLAWGGAEIYVAGALLAPGLGLSVATAIVGISVVVAIYAALGGFRAVVATDKLQFAIVALYVLAMAGLAVRGLGAEGDGLPPLAEVLPAKAGASWADLLAPGLGLAALSMVGYLPGWLFETDLWVRVQAARSERAARRGLAIAGVNSLLFVGVLPLFIGVAALILFPPVGNSAPAELGNDGDAIFAALVARYAPAWLGALVAVGLVAAAMSTIDTCANVVALAVGYDLLRLDERRGGEARSRLVTVGAMTALCVFALNTESLWDLFYLSGGVLTTAVALPVAAVFLPRPSAAGVTLSSAAGLGGTVLFYFLGLRGQLAAVEPDWLTRTGLGYIFWGLLAAAVGYVFGWVGDRTSGARPRPRAS